VALLLVDPEQLPSESMMDDSHRAWRTAVVAAAAALDLQLTHGVAAKLVNMYLKAGLVAADTTTTRVCKRFIHPLIAFC